MVGAPKQSAAGLISLTHRSKPVACPSRHYNAGYKVEPLRNYTEVRWGDSRFTPAGLSSEVKDLGWRR